MALSRVLWFGFGHRSFLRLPTERELGVNCAALCACLGETYGTPKAAELLQVLWEVNDFPTDLQPSRSQFGALVSGCSGLFLLTPFADIVKRLAGSYNPHFEYHDTSASPDLAATINGLFQVSRGGLKAIEIHGGLDIAFLSAVAYWLLDLTIWVQMHDGSVLFSNYSHSEEAVVRLHYIDKEDPQQRSLIQISATTFILGSVKDLISETLNASIVFRVKWENCLTQMFGQEGKRIQDQASLLGKALGAIARIYEAIANCEVEVGGLSRIHFVNFQPQGYGRLFVNSIGTILPEIGSLQAFIDGAEQSLSQNVANNVTTIYDMITQLKERCRCSVCKSNTSKALYEPCDVATLLFLRNIGDIIAHVNIDSPISPTIEGLHAIYRSTWRSWSMVSRASNGPTTKHAHRKAWLEVAMGISRISDPSQDIKDLPSTGVLLNSILDQVSRLFMTNGRQEEFNELKKISKKPHCTALSRNGACIWLDALRSANADPSSMSTIHVVPGQISYRNRQYNSVWDLYPSGTQHGPEMPLAEFATPGASANLPMQVSMLDLGLHAIVTERGTEGTIGFAFQIRSRPDLRYLQPGFLTETLLASTGRFPCSKTPDCSKELSVPYYLRKSGWNFPPQSRDLFKDNDCATFLLWPAQGPISKLLAIEGLRWVAWDMHTGNDRLSFLLLGSGQCMACLARYWQESKKTLIMEQNAYSYRKGRPFPDTIPDCFIHIV